MLAMLQRLQKYHESCGTEMTDESISLAFEEEDKHNMTKLGEELRPMIREMTAAEVRTLMYFIMDHGHVVTAFSFALSAPGFAEIVEV